MTLFSLKSAFPDRRPHRREEKSREKMFLEHYFWLRECALNITHGERERSEDLVHDVFLQFLDKDIDIASIADVRGYLNGILRNLHLLQLRRATRHPAQSLSLFDHDSALVGLRVWTSAEQLQSADSLVRACDFACHRKEASLAAGILILRYFHGYYPGEICLLLRAKRKMIYRWIDRGRAEMKDYMEFPYALPGHGGAGRKPAPPIASPIAFLRRLRERIFDSCTTPCLILASDATELGVTELAHLVSCRVCLDRRSRQMGLGYVAERMTDDISDNDDGRPQGGSGAAGPILPVRSGRKPSSRAILRRVYTRRRERFEHRPKEISLAFDGQLRATLEVTAPTNRLHLSLDSKEVPNSIAVLSEQEFHFLILDRDELTCSERRVHRLSLSDDRVLEVTVTPETLGPSIQIVYDDPLFLVLTGGAEDQEPQMIPPKDRALGFLSGRAEYTPALVPTRRTAFFAQLRNLVQAMNPLLTSAIVLGTVAVLCFAFWLRSAPAPAPGDLLDHAQRSERAAVSANHPGVLYEKVAIRTQRRTFERTIYRDAQGIRHPRRQQLSPEDEQLKNKLAGAGVNWNAPLSALDYAVWRQHSGTLRDTVARSGPHLLTLTTTPIADSAVLKETITVRDTDFHAVGKTVVLRDTGTVEIAELNYDVLPWSAVNPDWFDPLSTATDAPGMHPSLPAHLPHLLSELELDQAELEARVALNQLQADTGEQIHLGRSTAGIQVKGVVDTDLRKRALVSRLSQLPHVQASILSVEELSSYPQSGSPFDAGQPIQVRSVEAQASPLEQYLREKKLPIDQLATLSHSLLDGGLRIHQAELHFSELQPRFKGANQFPADLQNQLVVISRTYLNTVEAGLDANKRSLLLIGLDHASQEAALPEPSPPGGDTDQQIRRYQELCRELITSGTGEPRPAAAIAGELMDTDAQIRLRLAQLSAAIPRAQD